MRNEFRISRKKCTLFREISCLTKLALAYETQFRMFSFSRDGTFNIQNETAKSYEKTRFFSIKIAVS